KRLQPYLNQVDLSGWTPPAANQSPANLYVTNVVSYSDTYHVITVEADLVSGEGDRRAIALDVPSKNFENGQHSIFDEPAILHAKQPAYRPTPSTREAPQEIYDTATPVMTEFVRIYLTSTNAVELANMVAPGTDIQPIGPIMNYE